jgi:hypothetical protein
MKFLCVPCDQAMRLAEKRPPDRGSITLVYACDACGYEMAMLTNAYETQLVSSLGVKIGPGGEAKTGGCPVAGMFRGEPAAEPVATTAPASAAAVPWTENAERRLQAIPEFVRPMARVGIEGFARDRGYPAVDDKVMDEAREHYGM